MSTLDTISGRVPLARSGAAEAFRRIFSFPVLLGAGLVVGVFAWARLLSHDPDMWWHIAVGRQILETHTLPEFDPYSWTAPGAHWIAYEWLGEVLLAVGTRGGDLIAQKILLFTIAWALCLLLAYYAYLRSKNCKAAFFACLLLLPLSALFFTLRPQLLGYVFLLITLISLERFRLKNSKAIWVLPPLFLVWTNTHGSFAFGLFIVGLYWITGLVQFEKGGLIAERWPAAQRLRLELILLFCVVATMVTPYGTRLAAYPLEMALAQPVNVANIIEWLPLGTDRWFGKLFVGLLLLFFLGQIALPMRYRVHEVALLLFAVFSASLHRRFLIVFLIVFAPLLATMLTRWVEEYRPAKDQPVCNAALIFVMAGMMIWFFPSRKLLEEVVAKDYPVTAVQHLQAHPVGGRLFNEYGWGGYLIWSLHPQQKVFIDGRADIYEYSGVLPDYLSIVLIEPGALSLLRKYGVQACLVRRKDPISTLLAASPEWEQVYADEVSALFVRKANEEFPQILSANPSATSTAGLPRSPDTL
jgi:hypothetical protein